jgi:hypothetical protein
MDVIDVPPDRTPGEQWARVVGNCIGGTRKGCAGFAEKHAENPENPRKRGGFTSYEAAKSGSARVAGIAEWAQSP